MLRRVNRMLHRIRKPMGVANRWRTSANIMHLMMSTAGVRSLLALADSDFFFGLLAHLWIRNRHFVRGCLDLFFGPGSLLDVLGFLFCSILLAVRGAWSAAACLRPVLVRFP